ncbi:HAD hydrolase family protein [Candidatus Pseudothioglobus singularis]|jgi:3-deoxy-D-manno-octulosonate 8-phosphate phosphatase (KDO 8-P phosphatase)|nr:HAD hydrolase family protein [Candidatus Pseudothioglobus singularis]
MILDDIDALVFDFDGVLTNNLVYLNQEGEESVACSRADGLAFDVLRKLNKPTFILSTEQNSVVTMRAKKLKIPAIQGVSDKVEAIKELADKKKYNLKSILYVGNDLNDYLVMQLCGYSACPADSHPKIKHISDICLNTNGGNGVVRELLEEVLNIDFIKILY